MNMNMNMNMGIDMNMDMDMDSEDWEQISVFLRNSKYMDKDGYYLNEDGITKSTIVHQVDEFGNSFQQWMNKSNHL